MGRLLPFRRRKWTRARDFGADGRLHFWPERRSRVTARGLVHDTIQWLGRFTLAAIVAGLALPLYDPVLVAPPAFLSGEPEPVSANFTRCGRGRGAACVIDGDTFRLGGRRIRIIGIDAPETHPPRCAAEARLGEQATAKLQALLSERPFELVAPVYRSTDMYGRELRVVRRVRADGSREDIAEAMRKSGLARRYLGGFRSGWC